MPPDPPPSTRTKRLHPTSSPTDASDAYEDAMQTEGVTNQDAMRRPTTGPNQRLESMDVNQLWERLLTSREENGDVIVPANFVPIMSALLLSLKETTLRMNAMEAQLKASSEATQRLDKLERQFRDLIASSVTPVSPQPHATGLPEKPKSWATVALTGLKVSSNKAPPPPPTNQIINVFKPSQRKPFDGLKPTDIVHRINQALERLEVKVLGRKLEVKGAASLPSGSIKLFTATRAEAEWLLENRVTWSTEANPEFVTSPAVFPVVIDSVPMNDETYPETENIQQTITDQNPIPTDAIHSIR